MASSYGSSQVILEFFDDRDLRGGCNWGSVGRAGNTSAMVLAFSLSGSTFLTLKGMTLDVVMPFGSVASLIVARIPTPVGLSGSRESGFAVIACCRLENKCLPRGAFPYSVRTILSSRSYALLLLSLVWGSFF